MKKHTFHYTLAALLLLTGILTPSAVAREVARENERANLASPPQLSAFINIYMETSVDNHGPAIAYNSLHDEYLVVWTNTRGGGATKDIYARRVHGDGTLEPAVFTIVHDTNFLNYEPDVAYSPAHDEYLVVYTYDNPLTDSDIWARRVSWNGGWMSPEFALGRPDKSGRQQHPAVTYNPDADQYLVVWENLWGGSYDIDSQRVNASDGSPQPYVNVVAGAGYRSFPDVAYCPASNFYLVTYTFQPSSISDPGDVYGKVAPWDFSYPTPEIHICDDASDQGTAAVAASTEEFLVVWEDATNVSTTEIYARRLAADGTPQGPGGGFWITGAPNRLDTAPAVAYGRGYGYLIAWQRYMGGSDANVYGRYAMPGWDSGVDDEFALDDDIKLQIEPAVACNTLGDCLMAEDDNDSIGGDFEIRGRLAWNYHVFLPLTLRNSP